MPTRKPGSTRRSASPATRPAVTRKPKKLPYGSSSASTTTGRAMPSRTTMGRSTRPRTGTR